MLLASSGPGENGVSTALYQILRECLSDWKQNWTFVGR